MNVINRFHQMIPLSLADELLIEPGEYADYKRLARFHYKGHRPGAVTSILRIVHQAPTVVGRYMQRTEESQTVGVLVRSLPHLCCQLRDVATQQRYRGLSPHAAAVMLNREVRTISRVVIDPCWRGLGLAVKLVKHALENPEAEMVYTEALAAMGRVSPFFEHAGMQRYDRPPRQECARLIDAFEHIGIEAAQMKGTEFAAISDSDRFFLLHELRRWHRAAHRTPTEELHAMTLQTLFSRAHAELWCQPVYYIFQHGRSARLAARG